MKILFYDIETAPTEAYVWKLWKENVGINQIIEPGRVLSWASSWAGEDNLEFSSEWLHGAEGMIRLAHAQLSEADATVTFNGNHFDAPTLNAAFLKLGLTPPPPSKSIDLYQVVRKNFRFLSNRLDFVCKSLGIGEKTQTGGFELWTAVLRGEKWAQDLMEEYNCHDVELTEQLYYRLLPWIKNHPNAALYSEEELVEDPVCPNCGSHSLRRQGHARTLLGVYQRFQCRECGTWSRGRKAEQSHRPILTQDKTS